LLKFIGTSKFSCLLLRESKRAKCATNKFVDIVLLNLKADKGGALTI